MNSKKSSEVYDRLQQYIINGKLNRKQGEKVRPLLNLLFNLFISRELPNDIIESLRFVLRGKTNLFDEFKILSLYNEMNFKEIYSLFDITESDLHNLKNYYNMRYYKYPSKEFAQLKDKQAYTFQGFAKKRTIAIYDVSLEALNSIANLRFKVLRANEFEINILLGKEGKRTKFYPDRALKFVIPKNLFTNKRIKISRRAGNPHVLTCG